MKLLYALMIIGFIVTMALCAVAGVIDDEITERGDEIEKEGKEINDFKKKKGLE